MKITLNLEGEPLLAFQRAMSASRLSEAYFSERDVAHTVAHHLLWMASEAFAAAGRPWLYPVGRFELRRWTKEEEQAFAFLHACSKEQALIVIETNAKPT